MHSTTLFFYFIVVALYFGNKQNERKTSELRKTIDKKLRI